jgi:hypothetical protein
MPEIELMFGRNIGGKVGVTEEQWTEFVAGEMTPRFPDGLSVDDALGQWRDRDTSAIVEEPSKDVTLIVPQDAAVQGKIDAIVTASKERFKQQSVGVVMRPACASF